MWARGNAICVLPAALFSKVFASLGAGFGAAAGNCVSSCTMHMHAVTVTSANF